MADAERAVAHDAIMYDLLFAHWRVDASEMRRAVPEVFDLDLHDGEAWLGVVPFYMTNVGLRGALATVAVGIPGTECSHLCPSFGPARRVFLQPGWRPTARRRGGEGVTHPAVLCRCHERRPSRLRRALSKCTAKRRCGIQRHLRTRRYALRRFRGLDRILSDGTLLPVSLRPPRAPLPS